MDGNDFNLITPISGLQNVSSMSDVERRKKRRRKGKQKREPGVQQQNAKEETDDVGRDTEGDPDNSHRLDFRA
ncbi:MAG: hypothetical protein IIC50_03360 [Planctomycetes bacterium]|nr:hypothetical protein [Planctomycetota bacterium]